MNQMIGSWWIKQLLFCGIVLSLIITEWRSFGWRNYENMILMGIFWIIFGWMNLIYEKLKKKLLEENYELEKKV
jgi:hypothetical protein